MLRLLQRRGTRAALQFNKKVHPCDTLLPSTTLCTEKFLDTQQRRNAHTQGLYVHHTTGVHRQRSIAVTIGLYHGLLKSRSGIGFFTPVDVADPHHGTSRFETLKEVFKLKDSVQSMNGVSHARAVELVQHDRVDDLIDEILKAYETYKVNHDFVLVEGMSLKRPGDGTTLLNARIASTLGLSVVMVTNARKAAGVGERRIVRWDKLEWEKEVALNAQIASSIMKRNFVDVLGSIVHRLPTTKKGDTVLKKHFEELHIPYFGAIPEDPILKRIKVEDIVSALGADVLYGTHDAIASSKESSCFVAPMQQLPEALSQIKSLKETDDSIFVVTDASRPDLLLGLVDAHNSDSYPNLSAIVLAGGGTPQPDVDILIKELPTEKLPPIIRSPDSSFEIAATLADLEATILPDSHQKIEHAKTLLEKHVDFEHIEELLNEDRMARIHPKVFQHNIFSRAKQSMKHIVLPEGDEPRTVKAAGVLLSQGVCKLTMLGDVKKIQDLAREFQVDLSQAKLVNPLESENLSKYAELLHESRKHKGMTYEEALKTVTDVNYFGTCMVASGEADGMVSGAIHTTADTVRPALQVIKIDKGLKIASSVFFMCFQGKVLVFGDCAINTDPTSEELASIAISSAKTATAFGIEPRVALLSYATGDSNSGPLIQKVADAVAIARKVNPDLLIEGPLQYDAAVNPETAKIKLKGKSNPVAGKATVFIFPDLNTGNTTYKAVQQSTGAIAMGPVIQGLRKPVNDLSRGCTVDDIVSTVAITAVQAAAVTQNK